MPERKLNKYKEDADSLALAKSAREFAKLLGNGKTLTENISKIPPYYTLGNGRSLFDEAYQSKLGAPRSWYLENENKVKQKLIEQADRIENSKKTFVFSRLKRLDSDAAKNQIDNTQVFRIRPNLIPIFNIPSELALFDAGVMLDEKGNPFLYGRKDYYGKPEYISKEEAIKRAKVGSLGHIRQVEDAVLNSEEVYEYPRDSYYRKYYGEPAFKLGGSKRIKAALGTREPLGALTPITAFDQYNRAVGPEFSTELAGNPQVTGPLYRPLSGFNRFLGDYGLNRGDLAATGVQFVGNLASSLINNAAINRLRFTPIHTQTVAEAPVKFNTTYNINPQLDNLRESIGSVEREATNNSASSRTAYGRIANTRFRGIGAYNELYGQKLNQETAMLNADAQNRQNVRARNTNRLQQNIARDTIYNAQGEDNRDNTHSMYMGQNWSNFSQEFTKGIVDVYNRGQYRLSDANSLAYLFASNPNAARLFMNNNSLIRRIFGAARTAQGINI